MWFCSDFLNNPVSLTLLVLGCIFFVVFVVFFVFWLRRHLSPEQKKKREFTQRTKKLEKTKQKQVADIGTDAFKSDLWKKQTSEEIDIPVKKNGAIAQERFENIVGSVRGTKARENAAKPRIAEQTPDGKTAFSTITDESEVIKENKGIIKKPKNGNKNKISRKLAALQGKTMSGITRKPNRKKKGENSGQNNS